MKKLFILLFCLTIVSSCWTSTSDTATKTFEWTWFNINIPSSWINVESKDIPNPQNGKIELALTSSEISTWFANNMVILSEELKEVTDSKWYAITNYLRTTWSVLEFIKLNETNFNFIDKDEGKMYTFEAKYNTETPKRKFIQTAKVCDKKAYLITIGISLDITDVSKYENLLKSFECK